MTRFALGGTWNRPSSTPRSCPSLLEAISPAGLIKLAMAMPPRPMPNRFNTSRLDRPARGAAPTHFAQLMIVSSPQHHELVEIHDRAHDRGHRRQFGGRQRGIPRRFADREQLRRRSGMAAEVRVLFPEQSFENRSLDGVGRPADEGAERQAIPRRAIGRKSLPRVLG